MLPYFLGLTTLGSVRPYIRKHVYDVLEPVDFLFVNSLLISSFIAVYFAYVYFSQPHVIRKTYDNCCKLSSSQVASLVLLASFTVVSSLLFFDLEKNYNTPFINNIALKGFSTIILFLVGYFIFEESYSAYHTTGIVLTVVGLTMLLTQR
jgi:drug/metabolite transporter (DMT)-like permease